MRRGLRLRAGRGETVLRTVRDILSEMVVLEGELNLCNYDHDDVACLQEGFIASYHLAVEALEILDAEDAEMTRLAGATYRQTLGD